MLAHLAEHNEMGIWATDIGNAYLESFTKEKVYMRAGPEFGDREGHTRHPESPIRTKIERASVARTFCGCAAWDGILPFQSRK